MAAGAVPHLEHLQPHGLINRELLMTMGSPKEAARKDEEGSALALLSLLLHSQGGAEASAGQGKLVVFSKQNVN